MDIIIDGYNLIGAERGLQGGLEHKRNWLVQQVAAYRKVKQNSIIIVFDGWQAGSVQETEVSRDGIRVIYSRLGEKADAVIVRIARQKASGCVVVTSDREIRNAVERFGAVAISAGEFNRILRSLDRPLDDDLDEETDRVSDRKGNPNQLSKNERKRLEKLKKLRLT
jgi:predicted RNA-binding protein with PIN domain